MKIEIKKTIVKDLEKIPIHIKIKLRNIINELKESDNLQNTKNIKKLKGYQNFYRLDIGTYRLGFIYDNNEITLLRFLHRKEIYRYFP
jgi:mRNA interferase RelE/StbE